jgi:hypothetical protein
MKSLLRVTAGAAALSAAMLLSSGAALADPAGVRIGTLSCHVSGGVGYIIGSSRRVNCDFEPADNPEGEHYVGHISKFGMDIGFTGGGRMVWAVFAPSSNMAPGALQGNYVGATASATVGVGLGAHALVGGFDRSIALQPLSIEGNTGLNVAAGVGQLTLHEA